ncbi:MAG: alpha/beta hydrolase fold domain-containing protein [Planctomycetota bacterium]|jgi:acetyl esterase/lipase
MAANSRSNCYRPKILIIFLFVILFLTANHAQVNASGKKDNDDKPRAIARRSNPEARILRDLEYVPGGHQRNKLDLYLPKQSDRKDLKTEKLPLIIWVHGGAWMAGNKNNCPARRFLRKGYAIASINYRLSQHATFPAQIEDCKAAVRWLRANSDQYNLDSKLFGVWGASAGGHLVALLGTTGDIKEFDKGQNLNISSRVQAVCDYFGPTDFIKISNFPSSIKHDAPDSPESKLIGGHVKNNKEACKRANPITYVTKDDPPFLIVHGDKDNIVPHNQSQLLYEALKRTDIPVKFHTVKGGGHGGFNSSEVDKMVDDFFDKHLKNKKSINTGLASLYPGDKGIENDPRVLFVDDFETGTTEEIGERWGSISKKENITLSEDIHTHSPGNRSIHISKNGHIFTHTKGVDTMFARFYVKFHEKTGYVHHFVHLVADRTPTPWPKGGAGETPPGDAKFSTGIEPTGSWGKFPPPGIWNFYTYWHEMKTKWGSVFIGNEEQIQPGRWYCVEVMLKANSSPDKADGEQILWVDGKLFGRFTGFHWRTTDKLKINSFWLLYYNTDQPARHNKDPHPESRVMEVWFDDIVIATEYIGPVHGKPRGGKKKATPSKSALLTPGLLFLEPGKVVFSHNFEDGPGNFEGGIVSNNGVENSKAYEFGPKGVSIWDTYSIPVKDSTTIRFKLKPLCEVSEITVMIWSKKLKDNCRYRIGGLKKDQWRNVDFRAIEARLGWDMKGPSLEANVLDNIKLFFQGSEQEKILLDDFEILK